MKLVVASDIHGSALYCRKFLDCYKKENADKLILLGDILYHGPRNDLPEEYAPKKVLKFPILADYAFLYWRDKMVFITHGHNFNLKNLPMLKKGDILLHGHTHIPACEKNDLCTYINPGSVSIPKENSAHSYIVITDDEIIFKDLDGNAYKKVSYDEL